MYIYIYMYVYYIYIYIFIFIYLYLYMPYINVQLVCQKQVITVPLICDGFIQLTSETLDAIPDVWTAQQPGHRGPVDPDVAGEWRYEKRGICWILKQWWGCRSFYGDPKIYIYIYIHVYIYICICICICMYVYQLICCLSWKNEGKKKDGWTITKGMQRNATGAQNAWSVMTCPPEEMKVMGNQGRKNIEQMEVS